MASGGGGLVVRVAAFYFDWYTVILLREKNGNRQKEARIGPFVKKPLIEMTYFWPNLSSLILSLIACQDKLVLPIGESLRAHISILLRSTTRFLFFGF